MDLKKEPWTDDLQEFLSYLNPNSKSYEDVKKALELAWPLAFKKYATMLILKDETTNQEGMDIISKADKDINWEEDFNQWLELVQEPSAKLAWEEAYNTYVKYWQTQAAMTAFTEQVAKENL